MVAAMAIAVRALWRSTARRYGPAWSRLPKPKDVLSRRSKASAVIVVLQQAFVASNVPQCGFCIPGIIMAGAVLLKKSSNPTDEEIDAAITNLCRCGVYPRLRDAIKRAGRVMRGEERIAAAPPPGITPEDAARAVPALTVTD
ncbi:MAG: hypothetical protein RLZZ604_263 [Pseudomonadota bacterium]